MGSFTDKVKGAANIGGGRIKQGLARDTGDDRMEMEGGGQELKGHAQKGLGEIKSVLGRAFNRIGGRIKRS